MVNDDEQFSVWPAFLRIPRGWRAVGVAQARQECLSTLAGIRPDVRPVSTRRPGGKR
ncbi:MAG: MbtH family protein [Catenulispora sp.]|nr:MbtH family protein [Catenulispora sp.]